MSEDELNSLKSSKSDSKSSLDSKTGLDTSKTSLEKTGLDTSKTSLEKTSFSSEPESERNHVKKKMCRKMLLKHRRQGKKVAKTFFQFFYLFLLLLTSSNSIAQIDRSWENLSEKVVKDQPKKLAKRFFFLILDGTIG